MKEGYKTQKQNKKNDFSKGLRSGLFGIISNILLFCGKLIVGIFAHSIAITADAFNNLLDGASSGITVAGYKLASRPADREHPYGHARFEYISALVISIIMLVIGATFLKESIMAIVKKGREENVQFYAYIILGFSVLVKGLQAWIYGITYKKTKSLPMKAAAIDSMGDMFATTAAILSTIILQVKGIDLDGWFGSLISLFIMVTAVRLLKDSVSPLIGMAPMDETIEKIKEKILSYDGVLGVHDLMVHSYGSTNAYGVAHVEMSSIESLTTAHDLADRIEREVFTEIGVKLVVHVDPKDEGKKAVSLETKFSKHLKNKFPEISFHDFQTKKEGTQTYISIDVEIPWESTISENDILTELKAMDAKYEYRVVIDRK